MKKNVYLCKSRRQEYCRYNLLRKRILSFIIVLENTLKKQKMMGSTFRFVSTNRQQEPQLQGKM